MGFRQRDSRGRGAGACWVQGLKGGSHGWRREGGGLAETGRESTEGGFCRMVSGLLQENDRASVRGGSERA